MILKEYWPLFLQEIIDFQHLATAEQPEIDALHFQVIHAGDDFFITTLSLEGVLRWEKILGITPDPAADLVMRRQEILMAYIDKLPFTFRYLKNWLRSIDPGISASIIFYEYVLKVVVPQGYTMITSLANLLQKMIPANIVLQIGYSTPMETHAGAAIGCQFSYLRIGG